MNALVLNEVQSKVLKEIAEAEVRSPEQMLSLLLAEGVRFYFCDYCSPHGQVNEIQLSNLLDEDAKQQLITD